MEFSLRQAMQLGITIVVGALILASVGNLLSLAENRTNLSYDESYFKSSINDTVLGENYPILEIQEIHLEKDASDYDLKEFASAIDPTDGDITSHIEVYGAVDIHTVGVYKVRFSVVNSLGLKTTLIKSVIVN